MGVPPVVRAEALPGAGILLRQARETMGRPALLEELVEEVVAVWLLLPQPWLEAMEAAARRPTAQLAALLDRPARREPILPGSTRAEVREAVAGVPFLELAGRAALAR